MACRLRVKCAAPSPSRRTRTRRLAFLLSGVPHLGIVEHARRRTCFADVSKHLVFCTYLATVVARNRTHRRLETFMPYMWRHNTGATIAWFGSPIVERSSVLFYGHEEVKVVDRGSTNGGEGGHF